MLASMSPTKQFALGTRYAKGVEIDEGWPLYRRIISSGARMLALPLTSASDPMSGFFGIRKETVRPTFGFAACPHTGFLRYLLAPLLCSS